MRDAVVTVDPSQLEQTLDVKPGGRLDASGHSGERDDATAPPGDLAGHSAAHLAEPLDGRRAPIPAAACQAPQAGLSADCHAIACQQILERDVIHDSVDRAPLTA